MLTRRCRQAVEPKHIVTVIACVACAAYLGSFIRSFFNRNLIAVVPLEYLVPLDRYQGVGQPSSPVIRDSERGWALRREIAVAQASRQVQTFDNTGRFFFQNNWEPVITCAYERRFGSTGDGGKWVCDPDQVKTKSKVVVYSIGSNNDFSFEEAIYGFFGSRAEIHTFDFGNPVGVPSFVKYHQVKLGGQDSSDTKTLKTAMQELGHLGSVIDILKIDVEGFEYDVLIRAIRDQALAHVNQILIEIHLILDVWGSMNRMTPVKAHDLLLQLNKENFEIFHKEPNTFSASGDACEYSLVKTTWK